MNTFPVESSTPALTRQQPLYGGEKSPSGVSDAGPFGGWAASLAGMVGAGRPDGKVRFGPSPARHLAVPRRAARDAARVFPAVRIEMFGFVGDLSDVAAGFVEDVDHFVPGVEDVEVVVGLVDRDTEGAV